MLLGLATFRSDGWKIMLLGFASFRKDGQEIMLHGSATFGKHVWEIMLVAWETYLRNSDFPHNNVVWYPQITFVINCVFFCYVLP